MTELKVQVTSMRLMRNQVENVRAIFTVVIGPMRLIDCYLVGKREQKPDDMSVSMPGRWSRDGSSWKSLVCVTPDLQEEIKEKALVEYQCLIEPVIERQTLQMPAYLYAAG